MTTTTKKKKKIVSTGICNFCQAELDKAKMTQHLKYCTSRQAQIADQQAAYQGKQVQILHLLVEGQYNPQYWLHLEIPALSPLYILDDFLRDIWLECCGHLSAFTINGVHYEADLEDVTPLPPSGKIDTQPQTEEIVDEEGSEKQIIATVLQQANGFFQNIVPQFQELLPTALIKECRQFSSVDDLILFLQQKGKEIKWGPTPRASDEEEQKAYMERYFAKQLIKNMLQLLQQDESMDVPLQRALRNLKPGKNFFYEYDFGSTTSLTLRVISEREGPFPSKEEEIVSLMAQNRAPELTCAHCGKPAYLINVDYSDEDLLYYCQSCEEKEDPDLEMNMLPIVNSPRIGVCAYGG
ncbi:hypothetical protein KDW_39860 [Dictyobacter vulcani]|uniref:Uncharacterized protein n=1 Tax=Dictyobacter vulcani TaxID=2607529 RepID=A0A5J4KK04_9CHLR|nr:hypothetical protein [Dictyobacter vulcani]GER89824.1 hypothetical protein KDW_39860 [Dictyobacter vulcani]